MVASFRTDHYASFCEKKKFLTSLLADHFWWISAKVTLHWEYSCQAKWPAAALSARKWWKGCFCPRFQSDRTNLGHLKCFLFFRVHHNHVSRIFSQVLGQLFLPKNIQIITTWQIRQLILDLNTAQTCPESFHIFLQLLVITIDQIIISCKIRPLIVDLNIVQLARTCPESFSLENPLTLHHHKNEDKTNLKTSYIILTTEPIIISRNWLCCCL